MGETVTADLMIRAYMGGIFPMAIPQRRNEIYWFSPDPRAVVPLRAFRIPRSIRRTLRSEKFRTTTDAAFAEVIENCAAREETWISDTLKGLYIDLHKSGFAHSVETWLGDELVGGLYGVALGGAFFGESMFHTLTDASNVALVDLIGRLIDSGYELLDTQYLTPHLERFGAVEIPRDEYLESLGAALKLRTSWQRRSGPILPTNQT